MLRSRGSGVVEGDSRQLGVVNVTSRGCGWSFAVVSAKVRKAVCRDSGKRS